MSKRDTILNAALQLAQKAGSVAGVTREQVAQLAEVSPGLINAHFHTMAELKAAVLRDAHDRGLLCIVAPGSIAVLSATVEGLRL